jgi:hypothetical protein
MRTPRALLPLAVAAGLAVAASPAAASDASIAQVPAGEDAPPTVPSLIQTRITRTENALERLTEKVDDGDSAGVVRVSKVIRRQTAAAWRGAKYYLRTAPPPVSEDLAQFQSTKRQLMDDPAGPVIADQYVAAAAVFGLAHDVASQAIELTDGAHGNTLAGVNRMLFWTLDKRDAMVQDAKTFEPAVPAEDLAEVGRSLKAAASSDGGVRKLMDDAIGGSFAALMPFITGGLDDELQHIDGLRTDATDLNARGKSILRQAQVQILLTHHAIDLLWPPVPAED